MSILAVKLLLVVIAIFWSLLGFMLAVVQTDKIRLPATLGENSSAPQPTHWYGPWLFLFICGPFMWVIALVSLVMDSRPWLEDRFDKIGSWIADTCNKL